MSTADVLVVGAGPAGSLSALILARAGLRVRLIDRARFPRPKLCGDTLNPGALAILGRVDARALRSGLASRVCAAGLPIAGMTVSGPTRTAVTAAYPRGARGVSVSRARLDQLLVEEAARAGALVVEEHQALSPIVEDGRVNGVVVRSARGRSESWVAPLVVIAEGRGARLSSVLGLSAMASRPRRWAFGAYFSGVAGVADHGEMHIRAGHYIGLSPLQGGLVNVCVVHHADGGLRHMDQRTIIGRTVRADALLRERFAGAQPVTPVMALGPLAVDARAAGCPGALLAGDAAGFIDPMTGDGLRFALRGAELAAAAALDELSTGRPAFAELLRARRQAFAVKWRLNRALRTVAGSPRLLGPISRLSASWTAPVEWLVTVAADLGEADVHRPSADLGPAPAPSRV